MIIRKTLSIVVPCYNEEEVIDLFYEKIKAVLNEQEKIYGLDWEIWFVDDGSRDQTLECAKELHKQDERVHYISFTRNFGKEAAIYAGLKEAWGDYVVTMDADLQDDINAIDDMLKKYYEGCDIVYGVRSSRKKDTWFKKTTAQAFYKFMKLMGVDIVYNHADYRLTSRKVLEHFADYKEVNLFLRGMFPLIGYQSDVVYYERHERFAGTSKYPLKKMLNFAWDGITSFSVKPIRFILTLGVFLFVISLIMTIYCIIVKLLGHAVTGWTFLACSIWMLAGVQMLSLGIIGEYVGKMYNETKARPRYIISRNLMEEDK